MNTNFFSINSKAQIRCCGLIYRPEFYDCFVAVTVHLPAPFLWLCINCNNNLINGGISDSITEFKTNGKYFNLAAGPDEKKNMKLRGFLLVSKIMYFKTCPTNLIQWGQSPHEAF